MLSRSAVIGCAYAHRTASCICWLKHACISVQVSVTEQLTGLERGPPPRWDTFCGVSGGAWQGQMAAFSPATGKVSCLGPGGRLQLRPTAVMRQRAALA